MERRLQIQTNDYHITKACTLKKLWLCFACLFFQGIYAQLPDFILTIDKTDATCFGNGTMTFNVSGTQPGATMVYTVYELPDETTPIAVQNSNFLGGREAGTYKVIATQILGLDQSTQTLEVTINSVAAPFTYTVASTNANCGSDATMTITVTAGTGLQYEIITGPETRPLQTSPIFTLLPAGIYGVRVFNECGAGPVVTHTLLSNSAPITVSPVTLPEKELPTCNSIFVQNSMTTTPGNTIAYPLSLHYTVYPPGGGAPITYDVVVDSGSDQLAVSKIEIPFYYDQFYTYDLSVTDGCGNTFTRNENVVYTKLNVLVTAIMADCGGFFLNVQASNYRPPINITIVEAPVGFVALDYNAGHPGPFGGGPVNYGSELQAVPFGNYIFSVTDGCGHTGQGTATLVDEPVVPVHEPLPYPGCQSNMSQITITIPGFEIASGIITEAPVAYTGTLPDDVSEFVTPDGLVLEYLIEGDYTIILTDDCGNTYPPYHFTVTGLNTSVSPSSWPACEVGFGSIRISGNNTIITSATMTAAPPEFPQTLPYVVSSFINTDGIVSMTGLPPGNYSFTVTDSCMQENIANVTVVGYAVTANDFTLTPHCGSFDITLAHAANGVSQTFWLQEWDPVTGTWGHPGTNAPYPEGTAPSTLNSYPIQNNFTTINLQFEGPFRIIKVFQTMQDGNTSPPFRNCFEVLQEFEFTGEFAITGFEKLTCDGEFADIRVLTNGVPPLIYKIIEKDGEPFYIDNGNNNLFTNLEPAIYTFTVQQFCGDIEPGIADVALLPSLANANQPDDMVTCDDSSNDGVAQFTLTDQDAAILGNQDAANFTITYHLTQEDAENQANPLPANYTSGNHIIFCRLEYNDGDGQCHDIVSFDLIVNPYPVLEMEPSWGICEGDSTTIVADSGFQSYLWSTGETTQSITVSQPGQFTLEVTKAYPTGNCSGIFNIEAVPSNAATIDYFEIDDWTYSDNTIKVVLDGTGLGNYVYSIDGVNYQESNTFTDLGIGPYTVYVKDTRGCGIVHDDVYLLTYPKFFTPNGDGYNDFWRIKFSQVEPHMKIIIFDRYGKVLAGFTPESPGWDGMLNGKPLPSTDYWFLVTRENGRELRGHFSMKR